MSGFRLAISLLRIPRLFVSLLLFPLFLSIVLVVVQLWITRFAMYTVTRTPEEHQERVDNSRKNNFVRQLVYGNGEKVEHLTVCRWESFVDDKGETFELPPQSPPESELCQPDRLDAAIHVSDPASFDTSEYEDLFQGNFERVHICKSDCKPDIVLSPELEDARADTFSLPAFMLLNQAYFDEQSEGSHLDLIKSQHRILSLMGKQFLHAEGYTAPVQLSSMTYEFGLLASIASIILIGLWLAIKAHRKVLDYFARSGALLPMVAALGKREFYSAIWIVTLLRVGAFLLASVPSTYMFFSGLGDESDWGGIFERDAGHFIMWLVALVASFSFAAIIASIADLKHRYNLFAFAYRYLPLTLAVLGSIFWVLTFALGDGGGLLRNVITATPIIGMGPIILVPMFQPSLNILVINTLLTCGLTLLVIRSNAKWFAAHLENL